MRSFVCIVVLAIVACEPQPTQTVTSSPTNETARGEACREDIPDCVAVCALRETKRTEYIDFYERRCAAVILGKNPDKVEPLQATPYVASTASAETSSFPPDQRGSLSLQPPPTPFDPSAVTRTGASEPAECKAARILRAEKRDREADMMNALCVAKGGDAGT